MNDQSQNEVERNAMTRMKETGNKYVPVTECWTGNQRSMQRLDQVVSFLFVQAESHSSY